MPHQRWTSRRQRILRRKKALQGFDCAKDGRNGRTHEEEADEGRDELRLHGLREEAGFGTERGVRGEQAGIGEDVREVLENDERLGEADSTGSGLFVLVELRAALHEGRDLTVR